MYKDDNNTTLDKQLKHQSNKYQCIDLQGPRTKPYINTQLYRSVRNIDECANNKIWGLFSLLLIKTYLLGADLRSSGMFLSVPNYDVMVSFSSNPCFF